MSPLRIDEIPKNWVVPGKNATNTPKMRWIFSVVGGGALLGLGAFLALGVIFHGSLPSWYASAIGTIGHTPHHWSLWAVTDVCMFVGSVLMGYGSFRVHKARMQDDMVSDNNRKYLGVLDRAFKEIPDLIDFTEIRDKQYKIYDERPYTFDVVRKEGTTITKAVELPLSKKQLIEDYLAFREFKPTATRQ